MEKEQKELSEEEQTTKAQAGTWNNLKAFPKKIQFEMNKPALVTFKPNFKAPQELPNTDGNGVFYIFEVLDGNGEEACIMTSAWTLLGSLKSQEPLAGKSLIITKKIVSGKQMYYVTTPTAFGSPKIKA